MPRVAKLARELHCLFVGTSEAIAKSAPIKGLEPTVALTDSYPGVFANRAGEGRWGILEVDVETLSPEYFVPHESFVAKFARKKQDLALLAERHKGKWKQSVACCGACAYLAPIPPQSIYRVAIIDTCNYQSVSALMKGVNLMKLSPPQHKEQLLLHKFLSKWASGYPGSLMEAMKKDYDRNRFAALEKELNDRTAVDLFYLRSEHPTPWWRL